MALPSSTFRDGRLLRTEPATNNVYDYGVHKDVENLPRLRDRMSGIIDNYHDVQQDILETFVDRGQLAETGRANHPAQWKADTRAQARSPAITGGDAFSRTLRQHCCRRQCYHCRPLRTRSDRILAEEKRCQLDRLYQCISDHLDALLRAVGLKIAA